MNPILKAENLSHVYGVGTPFEKVAIDNINLEIFENEFIGVIGRTGSGKSTLIQHLNGILRPSSGTLYYDGEDCWAKGFSRNALRFNVGLVFQYPEYQLFESTVYKDIAFGPSNMGLDKSEIDRRVRKAAEFVGLKESMFEKSPFDLSGGEKRRVAIAGVMAMEPEVLIMDEPAAGLDPRGRKVILDLIKNYREKTGSTVIIVSHSMEDVASVADRIIVLNKGKVAFNDSVDKVFSHESELREMGLNIPQITKIFAELKKFGFNLNENVYTVDDAAEEILRYLHKGGN